MFRLEPAIWLPGEPRGPVRGGAFIVWKKDCHRSTMSARCFGADIWFIWPFSGQAAWRTILRYIASFFLTVWLLATRRPRFVIVLNQPLPLVMAASYSAVSGARYALDCHSNAYVAGRNLVAARIYRHLTRRAVFNVNHNRADAQRVRAFGGRSYLIPEIPGVIEPRNCQAVELTKPNVVVACSFARDEPIELLLRTAAARPGVAFFFTGDYRKADPSMTFRRTENVVLLGYVSRETYLAYFSAAMAIVTLSTRAHIMQMAAEEAICLGLPLVTNRSEILEEVLGSAALFVDLDTTSLVRAIDEVIERNNAYRAKMSARREIRRDHLRQTLETIRRERFT